ncbi:MAG: hypothetical protein GF416_05785 [Candidatus Altiarchaeales archaeon]|nr:hypothetical protein [Candidatus Altiarchaeales archaeon]MBD3416626.1 hypothetical protein [Candidatus Altiarchaeales archaeon]
MKVLHIPCRSLSNPIPVLEECYGILEAYPSIGLVTTAQHLHQLGEVKDYLESKGKRVEVGGQILGCRQDAALKLDVDCILYMGSGRFHPLGVALKTEKQVYMLNPLSGVLDAITDEEKGRWLGKRKAAVKRAMESKSFGVMVSTKGGQYSLDRALELSGKLRSKGKEAFIFAGDEITPNNMLPFNVDCLVNTACPRIVGDDYHRPVLNPDDLQVFLKYL